MLRGRNILLIIVVLLLSYPLFGIGLETLGKDLSWSERDWNGDGRTTIGEFFGAMDVDVRPVEIDGKSCRDVYALKDGLTVKTLCP